MGKLKYGSIALTCLGGLGVIATSVLAARSTPKAMKLLEEAKEEKGEELTKVEVIKTAAPAYASTIAVGAATIACIIGIGLLDRRSQGSLMSAYALLDKSYRTYRDKVTEIYGENADETVKDAIAKDIYEEEKETLETMLEDAEDEEVLFLDMNTLEYFNAKLTDVIQKTTMDDGLECYVITYPCDTRIDYESLF